MRRRRTGTVHELLIEMTIQFRVQPVSQPVSGQSLLVHLLQWSVQATLLIVEEAILQQLQLRQIEEAASVAIVATSWPFLTRFQCCLHSSSAIHFHHTQTDRALCSLPPPPTSKQLVCIAPASLTWPSPNTLAAMFGLGR